MAAGAWLVWMGVFIVVICCGEFSSVRQVQRYEMLLETPRLYPKKRVSLFRLAMVVGFPFLLFMSRAYGSWCTAEKKLRACGVSTRPARETERLLEYLGKMSECREVMSEINGKTSELFPKTWEIF